MIQIDITLTKADIMAAKLVVYFRSGLGVAVTGLALALAWSNYSQRAVDNSSVLSTAWGPLIFGCLVIPFAVMFAGINGAAIKKMLAAIQYRFDDQGINLTAQHVTGRFSWPEVRRVYESRQLMVFTTPGALQVIPKRFASSETIEELKALLKTHMNDRAKLNRAR